MEFTVSKNNLVKALTKLGPAVTKDNDISSYIKLKTSDGILNISAFSLDVSITSSLNVLVDNDGEVVIEYKTLLSLVKKLNAGDIYFLKKEATLFLRNKSTEVEIAFLSEENFPSFVTPKKEDFESLFILPVQEFINGIERVNTAASVSDSRPILKGIELIPSSNKLEFVGLDGFRLSYHSTLGRGSEPNRKAEDVNEPFSNKYVVDAKKVTEISRLVDVDMKKFLVSFTKNHLYLMTDNNTTVSIRLLEGTFPDHNALMTERSFHVALKFNLSDLISISDRVISVSKLENNNNFLSFSVAEEQKDLVISTRNAKGSSKDIIPFDVVEGEIEKFDYSIALNYKYLDEALKSFKSMEEDIILRFGGSVNAVYVVSEKNLESKSLVLPIRQAK